MDEGTGLFLLTFTYKTVENIQRVEKEMRIDLFFKYEIAVLREIGLAPFFLHLPSGLEGIVDHINYAEDGYFKDE